MRFCGVPRLWRLQRFSAPARPFGRRARRRGRRPLRLQKPGARELPEKQPLLKLESICKHFGAIEALRGIDMEIDRGEVVALLGDNGAGKSTLVKIISGGLRPSSGRIVMEGEPQEF